MTGSIHGYDMGELEKAVSYIKEMREGYVIDTEAVVLTLKYLINENEELKRLIFSYRNKTKELK